MIHARGRGRLRLRHARGYASQHAEVSLWISRMLEMQGQEMVAVGQLDAFIGFVPPGPEDDLARILERPPFRGQGLTCRVGL